MANETKAIIVVTEAEPNKQKGYTKVTDEHGEIYSVWDEELQKLFKVGRAYTIAYKTKGSYKNITTATEIKTDKPATDHAAVAAIEIPNVSTKLFKAKCELLLACRDFVLNNFDAKDFPERHTIVNSLFLSVQRETKG